MVMVTPSSDDDDDDDDKTLGTGGNGVGGGAAVCIVGEAQVAESKASGPNTRIVVLPVVEASFVFVFDAARSESRC
jgi:hypothetical protein